MEQFEGYLNKVLLEIDDIRSNARIKLQPLQICTITVHIKSSLEKIRVVEVNNLDLTFLGTDVEINQTNSFYNSTTIRFKTMEKKKRAIKVFNNGSLHVTGYNNLTEAIKSGEKVLKLLDDSAVVNTFKIQMMNTCVKSIVGLDLNELTKVFEMTQHITSYDVERHPGLKVKVKCGNRYVTLLIFRTGSVLITGVQQPGELLVAFRELVDILDRNDDVWVLEHLAKKHKVEKGFDYGAFL